MTCAPSPDPLAAPLYRSRKSVNAIIRIAVAIFKRTLCTTPSVRKFIRSRMRRICRPTRLPARNKRRPTYFSGLKEFFDRSQFFCVRPSCSGKPHAQNPARRSYARGDFIEAEIRIFNELSEPCDQRPFCDLFSFFRVPNKSHKPFHRKETVG